MESNKNNNSNNQRDEQPQQLQKSARKRKLDNLANDGKPAGEEDHQQEEGCSKNSRREDRNDQDLEHIVQLPQVTEDEAKEIADENAEKAELPTPPPMKIQLSKETWFDMFTFVPRHQLVQIVPEVGNRRFAGLVQSFLHNYGRITLGHIFISGPGHRLIQPAVAAAIPENVKDFRYLNTPVINLLQKFKQNSLFGNVNLNLNIAEWNTNTLLKTLSHILPSIDNINSIRGTNIPQLVGLCNADSGMAMAMLKMARFLDIYIGLSPDDFFASCGIAFLIRWLHTPRDDGKPRVLVYPVPMDLNDDDSDVLSMDKIAQFVDGTIKSEFAKAKLTASFFIRFFVSDTVVWHDSSMENGETKEKLVIKKMATTGRTNHQTMALVSRYPLAAGKHWIETNEQEAINWDFDEQNGRICLAIPKSEMQI